MLLFIGNKKLATALPLLVYNLSVCHLDNSVCFLPQTYIMSHNSKSGIPFSAKAFNKVHDTRTILTIKVSSGFISKNDKRIIGKRSGKRHSLLFSSREL